jgi:hemerythrin-like domain-containing protein
MTYVIEILRQEHRNIEKLLRVLERELSVFDRGERPDYEVVLAVIGPGGGFHIRGPAKTGKTLIGAVAQSFKDYPESCHHPKEDMIFERLKERDAATAATIGNLEAEHQEGARRLRRVAETVEAVLNDQDFLRHTASDTMRDFIHHERQHMAMEERLLFPATLNALRPADWAEIALELADRHDPLSPLSVEGRFNTLRRNILKLEEEAEEARHPTS